MKHNFIIMILIALNSNIFAQNQIAEEILNKLNTTTKSYNNISLEFILLIENKNQRIKNQEKGSLDLEGDKFRLIMNNQTIINDGKSQWIYLEDINEVQIIENDTTENIISPNKLFSIFEEDYKYNYIGTQSVKGKTLHIIDIFPKKSQEFMKISSEINTINNQIEKITIYDKNGFTYTYSIIAFKTNTKIKPIMFNIADFPNAEVIDLR
mgnify:CR=1 FL=1